MRKFSQVLQAGKTVAFDSSHHGQALVMLYVQSLCSDWSKFDRWVNAENLCSFLKLVYFDSWSWQSFFLCDVFNCLFLLDLRNVACQSRKSDFGWHRFVFVFTLLDWKVWSDSGLTWQLPGAASRMVSLSNYCIVFVFLYVSNFMKPSAVYEASLCTFELRFETTIWPIVWGLI